MSNFATFIKQLTYQILALTIVFCLSGMSNIVCCITKCEIVKPQIVSSKSSSCHQTKDENLTEHSCCITKSGEDANTLVQTQSNDNSKSSLAVKHFKDFSTKMGCCLPSDEAFDITRVSYLDGLSLTNNASLIAVPTFKFSKNSFLPTKKILTQEKTYLRCCVFLI